MKKSDIKIKEAESSEITVSVSKKELKRENKKLQRTKKWREERRGNWTGSQLKSLASCGPGKSKLDWDNLDRLFSFGATAIKYIYENAMERKTGRYIDDGEGTWAMRYGTKVEPLIQKATKKKLKEMKVKGKLKEVGYKPFEDIPNAGVSSDSILVNKKGKTIASVEMKACTSWGTHYERTFEITSESSKDFWQVQGQIKAHEVDVCYYVVAQPPEDIKKYLFYQGDIMDLYDDFCKECPISIEIVKRSKLHIDALIKRITIAEDALNDWLAMGGSLKKHLDMTIKHYEKDPEKLEKYIPTLPLKKLDKDFFSSKKKKVKKKKSG
jgi:hypothetical protein